jgi:hypothetical protein
MAAPTTKIEYKIDLSGCFYGHDNPALRAFMSKYRSNKVPVKTPGKKERELV